MKILILQRFDLSSVSCARRVLCQTEELLKRGHEVYLTDFVHHKRQQEMPSVANLERLGAHIIPIERSVKHYFKNFMSLRKITPPPDIIHLWKAYPDASLLAFALSKYWKIPLHYDYDDWEKGIAAELTGSKVAGWIAGRWDRLIPHLSHTITAASQFLKKKLMYWGIPESIIWDAPVGADLECFHPRQKDHHLLEKLNLSTPVLVYSGQLEVASYAEQAIEVFDIVRREIHSTRLLIIGGGRKLDYLKSIASEKTISDRVYFTDYIQSDQIPSYLSLADVALAPFEKNNVTRAKSPLKIAEYLAMGLPVVASDVGETQAMTVGAGACVPCGDIKQMADKTLWILKHPGVQESMRIAGRQLAERKYNWKAHTDSLGAAYKHSTKFFR